LEKAIMTSAAMPAHGGKRSVVRVSLLGASAVFALLGSASVAQAKDAVETAIFDVDGGGFPTLVTQNGAGLTSGTYAIGTIMVDYFVTGFRFPTDWAGSFRMCMDTKTVTTKQATVYPADVHVRQVGSSGLEVSGVPATVKFSSVSDDPDPAEGTKCVDIAVSVPESTSADPEFQEDGSVLVANLQESTNGGVHLDTPTTVKARVTLVHPTTCVRAVHLVSNDDFSIDLGVAGIEMKINKSNKKLASNPVHMQHVVALVNTCDATQTVDVTASINENFRVFQSNGIRTTSLGQEVADAGELLGAGLDWDDLDNLNPAEMCLRNVEVGARQSFVFTQRVEVSDGGNFPGTYAAGLGRDLSAWGYDGFRYAMNPSDGESVTCPAFGNSFDQGEVTVPVNQVTVTGAGGGTQYAP